MKKAVITSGNKQFLVSEGDIVEVELLKDLGKEVQFEALLVVDGDKVEIGTPMTGTKVTATVLEESKKSDKVVSIRYKAKKRVRKVKGHRQLKTVLKVSKIA
jgi:large subunit ribosomal protein L21